MQGREITSRKDVALLVSTFYARARAHEVLGPIFNNAVNDWEEHLSKITDFWENNLFFGRKYQGNPMRAHLKLDQDHRQTISQEHFGHWLELWFATIDELFVGDTAVRAKERARMMAHNMFMRIFEMRKR